MTKAPTATLPVSDHDMDQLKKKAIDAGHAVAELASEASGFAASKMSEGKECLAEKYEHSKNSVHQFVTREPYKAIAIAAGVGLLLGIMLKRR